MPSALVTAAELAKQAEFASAKAPSSWAMRKAVAKGFGKVSVV